MKKISLLILMFMFFSCSDDGTSNEDKDTTAPEPVNIAIAATAEKISLSWQASTSSDVNEYVIYRGVSAASMERLDSISSLSLSYDDATVSEHTDYFYAVSVKDKSSNESDISNTVSSRLVDDMAPTAPTLSINIAYTTAVKMSWTKPSESDLASFTVLMSTDSISFNTVESGISPSTLSYTIESLVNDTKYYFYVKAIDGDGNEASSLILSATPFNRLESSWVLINQESYSEAIILLTESIDNSVDVANSKSARAWAYLLSINASNEAQNNANALADFLSNTSSLDNQSGLTISYFLSENYLNSTNNAELVHTEGSYLHSKLSQITQNLVRWYGAFSYWNLLNNIKTKEYLDAIEPAIDHSLEASTQLNDIERLRNDVLSKQ